MTVHIVPVGLSLAESLDSNGSDHDVPDGILTEWRGQRDENDGGLKLGLDGHNVDSSALLNRAFGSQPGCSPSNSSDAPHVSEQSLHEFLQVIDTADVANWNCKAGMSAEIDALRAHDVDLDDDDLVVLLASDTTKGLANALWNALALAEGDQKRVWYRDSLDHVRPAGGIRQQIVVMRVPYLDVESKGEFPRALQSLTGLAELIEGHGVPRDEKLVGKKEDLVFHVTGGYRSTLPYLIAIAEWLRSLRVGKVSAQLLPKKGGATMSLPLRKLDEHDVKDELGVFTGGTRTLKLPQTRLLLGYAYTERLGGFELTDFGRSMRTLFIPGG